MAKTSATQVRQAMIVWLSDHPAQLLGKTVSEVEVLLGPCASSSDSVLYYKEGPFRMDLQLTEKGIVAKVGLVNEGAL